MSAFLYTLFWMLLLVYPFGAPVWAALAFSLMFRRLLEIHEGKA